MKAAAITSYGPPEVLRIIDVPKPVPKPDQVLVKVYAGVVTPSDVAFRKGDPFIIRLIYGLSGPRNYRQGVEFAGVIEAVGAQVTTFRVGDAVFGMEPMDFGTHAEYLCLPATRPMARIPANRTYADMVGIADGAATALTFLRDVAKLKAGQRVLINGASGAVGGYAVQLAKYYGAHVTGVCSGKNAARVKVLGADEVIDYTVTDFTRAAGSYDVIFDAVGKSSFGACKRALTPDGVYMTTVPTLGMLVGLLSSAFGRKKAKFTTAGLKQSPANFEFLRSLAEQGVLQPFIDRMYRLDQMVEAHRYVETGRKCGNVVIEVAPVR